MYTLVWQRFELTFKKPATTSRGTYTQKTIYIIGLSQGASFGLGEIATLPDLSIDGQVDYETILPEIAALLHTETEFTAVFEQYRHLPALLFALEAASMQLKHSPGILSNNPFVQGKEAIPINGLVWMGTPEVMLQEAIAKLEAGFKCLKFKVGAQEHDTECRMLEQVRQHPLGKKASLRLDANGAYAFDDAGLFLNDFKRFDIHSIEQPIKAGQWDAMQEICAKSPIDIALDEELIGVSTKDAAGMLRHIQPQWIILKPGLIGGFSQCNNWIHQAREQHMGWWATSALESNIGLSHIAQWVSSYPEKMHQGLGTGALFTHNFPSQTRLQGEQLQFIHHSMYTQTGVHQFSDLGLTLIPE
jgi:o-succinylbenzoate synthase